MQSHAVTNPTVSPATTRRLGHHIGGKAVPGTSGREGSVFNPATGAIDARVALASPAETEAAIHAASAALPAWQETPPLQRARVLEPSQIDCSEARPGAKVTLNLAGRETVVRILGPWDSNPAEGIYSYEAPMAKELLGKSAGDQATWNGELWTISRIDPWL